VSGGASPTIPEPVLDAQERAAFERGVTQFNAQLFFECHDTLEELWSGLRGPWRDFFQGLIQVSVAFYHLGNGNLRGAPSMLDRALRRLGGYPPVYYGFDLASHRAELERWRSRLLEGDLETLRASPPPSWDFAAPP